MYKIKWDSETNIVILNNNLQNEEKIISPRPVYHEELNLFGFNRYLEYPESENPLLWAIGREYYYKGILVATLKGGNLYNSPDLEIIQEVRLEPIQIERLIEKNIKQLITLDSEAKEFVNKIFMKYKNDSFISVAFSGGKDSQAILEIVSQVIPPDEYMVVFTDTGMEIPFTLQTVEKTRLSYSKQYPGFRLVINKPVKDIFELWKLFGPPSRASRWCCSVCKTTPFVKLLNGKTEKPIIDIEGVREDESNSRNNYTRILKGKNFNVTNIHPILKWNTTEVFLYLYYKKIDINPGYRYGLWRIGCALCPFSSPLSEYVINKIFPDFMTKFIQIVKKSLLKDNVTEKNLNSFIIEKNWAKISRNANLIEYNENYDVVYDNKDLIISTNIKLEKIINWMNVLSNFKYSERIEKIYGNFIFSKRIINFQIKKNYSRNIITFYNEAQNIMLSGIINRIMNKSIFCVQCNSCEVECPQGAIDFNKDRIIDDKKCVNCLRCIMIFDNGCINAKSRKIIIHGESMKTKKTNINRYWGFGLEQKWLEDFLNSSTNWIQENDLGVIQKKALKNWLKDAQLLDHKNKNLELTLLLRNRSNLNITIQLVWVLICENSLIMNWYSKLNFVEFSKEELLEKLSLDFPSVSPRTRLNALNAVINTLDKSNYLSKKLQLGILTKKGRAIKAIYKKGTNDVDPATIIYCLYRYAEKNGYYDFTLSELYEEGIELTPYRIFGIEKEYLLKILISMQEVHNKLIRVEFAANLDNIFLNNEYTSLEVLEILLEKESK